MSSLEQLLEAVRRGESGAWVRFVERYERLVYSVPRRMGFDEADSEDIAQAAWVLIHRHLEHVRTPAALGSWLVTTTSREAARFGRSRQRRRDIETETVRERPLAELELPDEEAARLEAVQAVRDAIEELDERCAQLLRCIDLEGTSYKHAAVVLGMPAGSIGPTRMRCLARLLPGLQARGLS